MVQLVLVFGTETWVVTLRMGRVLGGFQDQVVRRLTERLPQIRHDRKWYYTSASALIEEAGFKAMEEYISRRQNMFAQFIDTR